MNCRRGDKHVRFGWYFACVPFSRVARGNISVAVDSSNIHANSSTYFSADSQADFEGISTACLQLTHISVFFSFFKIARLFLPLRFLRVALVKIFDEFTELI